jgi:glycerophosphoryl diester phosphodiesterase
MAPVAATAVVGLRAALPGRVARMLDRAQAGALMLFHSVISRAAVERAHARGAAVFAWTVNDAAALDRMVAAGVDGVITDDPRIFQNGDYTQ